MKLLWLLFSLSLFSCKNSGIVHHPQKKSLIEAVYGLGTVSAAKIFHLKIGVMSMIRKINVEEGQSITEGTTLMEFDSIPPIKSPISGLVTSIAYRVNEVVFPQMNILTVMDISDKYITLSMEEESVIRLKLGQKARISLESLKDKVFIGQVHAVYPGENQFIVKVFSSELPREVLPGMTADVSIETSYRDNAILIPVKCVKDGKIIRIRDGKKESISVITGSMSENLIEVQEPPLFETDEILE